MARDGYLAILEKRFAALDVSTPEAARLREITIALWQRRGDKLLADLARDAERVCGDANASIESLVAAKTAVRLVVGGRAVHYKRLAQPIAPRLQALVTTLPLPAPLHTRWMYEGDACLWDETIEPEPCATIDDVRRYNLRIGEWLGVAAALGITDLHGRNVCAHGEHPVLLDVETIHTGPISPIETGLLPAWLEVPPGTIAPQIGGLQPGGTVVFDGKTHDAPATWPLLDGVRVPPREHTNAILEGLAAATAAMTAERVASWHVVARVPQRSPRAYAIIMRASLAPECLADAEVRRARIRHMLVQLLGSEESGEVTALLDLEIPTMERRYVPKPIVPSSAADRSAIRTLVELGSGERAPTAARGAHDPILGTDELARTPIDSILLGDLVLAAAERHGDRLAWRGAMWLPAFGTRAFAHAPMDLLCGQAGFAIVFAALHRTTGELRFRDAARGCLRSVIHSLADRSPLVGAYAGLGGRLFALRTCAAILEEPDLEQVAASRFEAIDLSRLAARAPTDIVGGLAGLLRVYPEHAQLAALVAAAPARSLLPGTGGVPPALREGKDPVVELVGPPSLDALFADGVPLRHAPCALTGALALAYRTLRAAAPALYPSLVFG